ncbi:hypothetical protein ACH4A6_10100 [Streptomyces atroolivaceus]|uniref:hypothetical protein n=1 Tax=Streptomyces atroolivaceus TaxID=66869 RepID=UPI0037966DC9
MPSIADAWNRKYPAIVRRQDPAGRKARGHFPSKQSVAQNCFHMAIMSLNPTGKGPARWTMRWKTAFNPSDIAFDGPLSAARQ